MPSKKAIVRATGIALALALAILFIAVLPAEYGIDPLKTGAALGLTDLSKAAAQVAGAKPAPVAMGVYLAQPKLYKTDSEDLGLAPGEGVEIKYHMQKGATMVYAWKATGTVGFEIPRRAPICKPRRRLFRKLPARPDPWARTTPTDRSSRRAPASTAGFWENKRQRATFRSTSDDGWILRFGEDVCRRRTAGRHAG